MESVKRGDIVLISFIGMLGDGTVFDSAPPEAPLKVCVGAYKTLPIVEDALIGMSLNETKTIAVSFEDGYGEYRPEMIAVLPRKRFPESIEIEIGKMLQVQTPSGKVENVVVTETNRKEVTLDANHPLSGKDLIFEVTIRAVRDAALGLE